MTPPNSKLSEEQLDQVDQAERKATAEAIADAKELMELAGVEAEGEAKLTFPGWVIRALVDDVHQLRAENTELTRKGEELCVAYGNSLMEIAKLKGVVTAAKELEQFLTHDIGMDKLELTYLRQQLAALESPDGE